MQRDKPAGNKRSMSNKQYKPEQSNCSDARIGSPSTLQA